ncbi:hypothetical protein DFP72DRAFT_906060 [Ephemerocybe angulata]|uniref:MYND-type domain-containing protein n=1 Tax=Ephemerocybe angulata TaxID=980116 RepID=A0A8H6HSZ2_9AGAR|nr:hypothetical protein DFP72DRAFT_906060 [Tulosesus angulatus]
MVKRLPAPEPVDDDVLLEMMKDVDLSDPKVMDDFVDFTKQPLRPLHPPPQRLVWRIVCGKPGTMACANCKLVSYCSKDCQRAHWKIHKQDCKCHLRSEQWVPIWRVKGRKAPPFAEETLPAAHFSLPTNRSSVGEKTPPIDLIHLKDNEKDRAKDLSLLFLESGDLRHVVKTVNSLPDDFTGKLQIVINDKDSTITARNLVMLLLLGGQNDALLAVDAVIHFWFSTFLPFEYHAMISGTLASFTRDYPDITTGLKSSFGLYSSVQLGCDLAPLLDIVEHLNRAVGLSPNDAQEEYDRVRQDPSRKDATDWMYAGLKPSHRASVQQYRRMGLVLPFGAVHAHFNATNVSLFSPEGIWLQHDSADPIHGWNINEVIASGKAQGAQPEDIYGCLYFHLSDQLKTFAKRIRNFSIDFKLFAMEPDALLQSLKDGPVEGVAVQNRFDRIDVSNVVDREGLEKVLSQWTPLLSEGDNAAVVGLFQDWAGHHPKGSARTAKGEHYNNAFARVIDVMQMSFGTLPEIMGVDAAGDVITRHLDLGYNNDEAFHEFLMKQELEKVLGEARLVLRGAHRIVPHRIGVNIKAPSSALPEVPTEEVWYRSTNFTSISWAERYVEIGRLS